MKGLEEIRIGSIEMSWDAGSRLATIRFMQESRATGKEAVLLVAALTRWIGTDAKTFGLLGDGENLGNVDAEYRAIWADFTKQHREHCYIAFFNMKPFIRVAAEMFRIGTGVQLKAFADEKDARSWLRQKDIPA